MVWDTCIDMAAELVFGHEMIAPVVGSCSCTRLLQFAALALTCLALAYGLWYSLKGGGIYGKHVFFDSDHALHILLTNPPMHDYSSSSTAGHLSVFPLGLESTESSSSTATAALASTSVPAPSSTATAVPTSRQPSSCIPLVWSSVFYRALHRSSCVKGESGWLLYDLLPVISMSDMEPNKNVSGVSASGIVHNLPLLTELVHGKQTPISREYWKSPWPQEFVMLMPILESSERAGCSITLSLTNGTSIHIPTNHTAWQIGFPDDKMRDDYAYHTKQVGFYDCVIKEPTLAKTFHSYITAYQQLKSNHTLLRMHARSHGAKLRLCPTLPVGMFSSSAISDIESPSVLAPVLPYRVHLRVIPYFMDPSSSPNTPHHNLTLSLTYDFWRALPTNNPLYSEDEKEQPEWALKPWMYQSEVEAHSESHFKNMSVADAFGTKHSHGIHIGGDGKGRNNSEKVSGQGALAEGSTRALGMYKSAYTLLGTPPVSTTLSKSISICIPPIHRNTSIAHIAQWMEYHLMIGVTRFHVFPRFARHVAMLMPWVSLGVVSIELIHGIFDFNFHNENLWYLEHNLVHTHCVRKEWGLSKWMVGIEMDEYLVPGTHSNHSLLQALQIGEKWFKDRGGFRVGRWYFSGEPEPVTDITLVVAHRQQLLTQNPYTDMDDFVLPAQLDITRWRTRLLLPVNIKPMFQTSKAIYYFFHYAFFKNGLELGNGLPEYKNGSYDAHYLHIMHYSSMYVKRPYKHPWERRGQAEVVLRDDSVHETYAEKLSHKLAYMQNMYTYMKIDQLMNKYNITVDTTTVHLSYS